MAKLTIVIASFIALLFLVDASIYRTTVIIDDESQNPRSRQEDCRDQFQRQQNLRGCQEYLRRQTESRRGRDDDNEKEKEHRKECCSQLQRMDAECRCEGLRMAIEEQQREGQIQGEDVREAFREAQDLPSRCGVSPSQCQFRGRSFWF